MNHEIHTDSMDNIELENIELKYSDEEGLALLTQGQWQSVEAKLCFPWSYPEQFISLMNKEQEQLVFIEEIERLPEKAMQALQMALLEARFCFVISEVCEISDEFELRNWWVKTESGDRFFQTKINYWPQVMGNGQVLLYDLCGDTYVIRQVGELSSRSQQLLRPLLE